MTNDSIEEIQKNLLKDKNYYETKYKNTINYLLIILLIIIFVIIITVAYHKIYKKYGKNIAYNYVHFPFIMIGSLFILFGIYQMRIQNDHLVNEATKNNIRELSRMTQNIVVDGWENDAIEHPELNKIYESIFSRPSSNKNGFLSKKDWDNLGLNVPYIPFKGNELEWHYSAKFIQEMVNIYRINHLDEKFKVGNKIDLEKSKLYNSAGWINSFKMWMAEPIVRNVYEQYKYRHVNPDFTAWVQYFIINPLDEDPNYWIKHKKGWDNAQNFILNKNK